MLRSALRARTRVLAISGAVAMLTAMGCAPKRGVEHLTLEPVVIHVGADGLTSAETPDPELDRLADLQEKGECAGALSRLERFVEDFPESSRWMEAVYRLGVCEEQIEHLDRARGYYRFIATHARGEAAAQGALRAAYVLESLGRFERAAAEYGEIAGLRGASVEARTGARLRRSISLFRASNETAATRALREALASYASLPTPSASIRSAAAEAQFAAAEALALKFEAVKLDDAGWRRSRALAQRSLNARTAKKAHLFVESREAYTDVVSIKDAEWAAAAVFRVGELSEHFYTALVEVPPPRNFTAAQQAAYAARTELRAKPLKQQAFDSYLRVTALGERVGLESPWIEKARERVKVLEPQLRNEVLSADPQGRESE